MKNTVYWAYNLPLQVWPIYEDPDDENSTIIGTEILNYMPRKEEVVECDLKDLINDQTRQEFFETAALHFENMAKLMKKAATDESFIVYYHDEGMDKEKP